MASNKNNVMYLYGPRATGITVSGAEHDDEGTIFSLPIWSASDPDDILEDLRETARLCGCDAQQGFEIREVEIVLPPWWDDLSAPTQGRVIAEISEHIDEGAGRTHSTFCGSDFADDADDDE